MASVPTDNTAAYELYLQAKRTNPDHPETRVTEAETEQSIQLYRRAVELDSTFADAWARLADAYVGRAWRRNWDPAWADSGRRATERALELNPDLAYAHVQLGDAHWVLGNMEKQAKAYRRAWELRPELVVANNLIVSLGRRGRFAQKLKWMDRVLEVSPGSPGDVRSLVTTNLLLGRDSVAEAWRRYARERGVSLTEVDFHVALLHHADVDRALALLQRAPPGETAVGQRQKRAALALYRSDWTRARRLYRQLSPPPVLGVDIAGGLLSDRLGLAWALEKLGQRREAEHIAEQVRADARDAVDGNVPGSGPRNRLAVAHLLLGDTGRALDWLETAVDVGERNRFLLESVPTLAPLRQHRRFQRLLDQIDEHLAEQQRRAERNGWGEPREVSRER